MSGVWGPTRAELDRDSPLEPPVPTVSYIVCSTPRSGSGLLCRGLAAAGAGGVPAEYLNPRQRGPLAARWGCGPSIDAYAGALRRHRTDEAGTFGIKLHWNQLEPLHDEWRPAGGEGTTRQFLEELFPASRFVHIIRLDLTEQAVSLWRAKQSDIWAERKDGPPSSAPAPRYSYRGIRDCRREIAEQEAAWVRFFRSSGIDPIEVVYEDLSANYGGESARVLREIGAPVTSIAVEPDSRRQTDQASAALVARFEADDRRHRHPGLATRALGRARRRLG